MNLSSIKIMLQAGRHYTNRLVLGLLVVVAYLIWSNQRAEIDYLRSMVYTLEFRVETLEQTR